MRKIFGAISIMSFLFIIGTVGSVEQDTISLGTGIIHITVSILAFWLFTWLAGWFNHSYTYDKNEESRPRCSRPKDGKRKSSI